MILLPRAVILPVPSRGARHLVRRVVTIACRRIDDGSLTSIYMMLFSGINQEACSRKPCQWP